MKVEIELGRRQREVLELFFSLPESDGFVLAVAQHC